MTTTTKKKANTTPLQGEALLNRVRELEHLSREDKAKECGYYTIMPDGSERLNMMKFLNALIDAEGIELDSRSGNGHSRGGRSASYRISVQANGNLLIGSAYTRKMELNAGDEFEISLGRRHIHLKQVTAAGDATEGGEE
ncbi:MAG: AbrB family transcriptional regulator [Thermosynechococcaceae cyanobacterium]